MTEINASDFKLFDGFEQRRERELVVAVLSADRCRSVAGECVVNCFLNADRSAQVLEGVAKTVKYLAGIRNADFLSKVDREPVAEVTAAFATRVELQIREQIATLSFLHVPQEPAGNQCRMQGDVAARVFILELSGRVAKVRDDEIVPQPLGSFDVAHAQLGKFFQSCAGKKRQQWQPVTSDSGAAQGQVALGVDRGVKDGFQIFLGKAHSRFIGSFEGQLEIVCRVFVQYFLVNGGIKYGF